MNSTLFRPMQPPEKSIISLPAGNHSSVIIGQLVGQKFARGVEPRARGRKVCLLPTFSRQQQTRARARVYIYISKTAVCSTTVFSHMFRRDWRSLIRDYYMRATVSDSDTRELGFLGNEDSRGNNHRGVKLEGGGEGGGQLGTDTSLSRAQKQVLPTVT